MPKLVLHPITEAAVQAYIKQPSHALLITGAPGSGKGSLSQTIVSHIFKLDSSRPESYQSHPYIRIVRSAEGKAIPVDTIRELQQFLSLKVPTANPGNIQRAIIIEDAQLLTKESQNALLKTLEEPPADTILILLAPSIEALLPTIQSRVSTLAVLPPGVERLKAHFAGEMQYDAEAVSRALMLSGELPGLARALLDGKTDHPLAEATTHARGILGSKTYERLLLVDSLSKQKQLCFDILFVISQMSRVALMNAATEAAAQRWQRVLLATYQAEQQLGRNTQAKLVLTNLMLAL